MMSDIQRDMLILFGFGVAAGVSATMLVLSALKVV
jgi:hypothetical protein